MAQCKDCERFYVLEEDDSRGDCIQKGKDERQAYFYTKPVRAEHEADGCDSFHPRKN